MDRFNSPPRVPVPRDWQSAPKIVKGWSYQLSWLAIVVAVLGIVLVPLGGQLSPAERLGGVIFYAVLLALYVWLNRALKNGVPAAWTAQMILSILGLIAFPLGTLIHGYILSQWFKPENRAWF